MEFLKTQAISPLPLKKKKMHKALCNMSSQRWHLRSVAPHNSRCLARLFSGPAAKLSCKPCSAQNWTAKECALAKKLWQARETQKPAEKQNETDFISVRMRACRVLMLRFANSSQSFPILGFMARQVPFPLSRYGAFNARSSWGNPTTLRPSHRPLRARGLPELGLSTKKSFAKKTVGDQPSNPFIPGNGLVWKCNETSLEKMFTAHEWKRLRDVEMYTTSAPCIVMKHILWAIH